MGKSDTAPVVMLIIFIFATLLLGLFAFLRYNAVYKQGGEEAPAP